MPRPTHSSATLTFLDQSLSSLTNFGGSALAAGLLTASDFGAFAVSVSILVVTVGVSRSWCGNSLMLIGCGRPNEQFDKMFAGSAATSVLIGITSMVIVALAGLAIDGSTGQALLSLSLCLPFVLLQDVYRYRSLSRRQPIDAIVNDGAWLVGVIAGLMILRRTDTASLSLAILAANGTAAIGLFAIVSRSRVFPRFDELSAWLRECAPVALRLTGDFVVAMAYGVIPLVLLTAWNANLEQAGSLRAAQVLMGPLAVLFAASLIHTQPIMVSRHRGGGSIVPLAVKQSITNVVIAGSWVGVATLIPDRIGVRVFGASWQGAQGIVLEVGLAFVALAVSIGPLTAMRSRGQLTLNLITQCLIATSVATMTLIGGVLVSEGILRGFAAGNLMGSAIAWMLFLRRPIRDMLAADTADR